MNSKKFTGWVIALALIMGSCGSAGKVADTVKSWFRDETRTRGQTRRLSHFDFTDKLRGAWAGKMVGVSYGAPYEFRYKGEIMQEGDIRTWRPEYVSNALEQDDLYVQMTFLEAFEEKGLTINMEEAGQYFANTRYQLWHANDAARKNIWAGILPPNSGHPRYNPHANDIDFQIESDLFGIICPAMPHTAMRLAEEFGHIMNYGDGVYGGLFVAGMYSVAYLENNPENVVRLGLACIPERSQYAQLIRDVLAFYEKDSEDWQACWKMLEDKWAQNDFCPKGHGEPYNIDAKLNGGYVVIGLLYGKGDFAKTLEITTRCGQDNDCNPSTAAGILGTILGYNNIPREYTIGIPLIADRKFSYTQYDFDSLVKASTRMAREAIERQGGEVERLGEREYYTIPIQKPTAPDRLEQFTESMFREFQPQWENLDRVRYEGLQRKLQDTLNSWAKGWTISQCGVEHNPGVREEYQGRFSVLVTHPLNQDTPCQLTWKGTLPNQNPSLHLIVTCSDTASNAGWILRVKVNGTQISEKAIEPVLSEVQWFDLNIDLTQFAGQQVTIHVENAAGDGEISTAFWGLLKIQS